LLNGVLIAIGLALLYAASYTIVYKNKQWYGVLFALLLLSSAGLAFYFAYAFSKANELELIQDENIQR